MKLRRRWSALIGGIIVLGGVFIWGGWYVSTPDYKGRRLVRQSLGVRPRLERWLARVALVKSGPRPHQDILRELAELREVAARAVLSEAGKGVLGRYTGMVLLWSIGPPAIPEVLHAMEDENPRVRLIAASALGKLYSFFVRTPEYPACNRPATASEAEAAFQRAVTQAVPALIQAVGDADAYVREAAVDSLGRLAPNWTGPGKKEAIVAAFGRAVKDEDIDPWARARAAWYLAEISPEIAAKEASGTLLELLQHPNATVRRQAANVVEEVAPEIRRQTPAMAEAVVAALKTALRDTDREVREAAARALERMGTGAGSETPGKTGAGGHSGPASTTGPAV